MTERPNEVLHSLKITELLNIKADWVKMFVNGGKTKLLGGKVQTEIMYKRRIKNMSNIYCRIKGEKYKVSFKENLNSVFFTSMIDKNKSYNFPFTMKVSDAVKVIRSSK